MAAFTIPSPYTYQWLLHPHSSRPNLRKPKSFTFPPLIQHTQKSLRFSIPAKKDKQNQEQQSIDEEVVVEVEEDLPWIQEKALDLVEFTGSVSQAIPGPRVGTSSLPWILAVPFTYLAVTFVIAFVRTVNKFNSPKHKRRNLVNRNLFMCRDIDGLIQSDQVQLSALKEVMQKTGYEMEEVIRKYVRYALNEKPFNPEMVADLIQLRKASMLDDTKVAEIFNEISRRVVTDKGPVVMNKSGYSENGFKRKLAVQTLFGKIFYLSELPELCSRDSSLIVKELFGVTDDDADILRIHAVSEDGDMESLQKMVDNSDSDNSGL